MNYAANLSQPRRITKGNGNKNKKNIKVPLNIMVSRTTLSLNKESEYSLIHFCLWARIGCPILAG
jgi:hypothetical protein